MVNLFQDKTNDKSLEIEIRVGRLTDIDSLVSINHKWQRRLLGDQIQNGFLSASFDKQTFETLVEKSEIVIAVT